MKTGLLNYRQKREGEKGWQKRNGCIKSWRILPSISLIVILLISSFEIGAYGDWNFYEKNMKNIRWRMNFIWRCRIS